MKEESAADKAQITELRATSDQANQAVRARNCSCADWIIG